MYEHASRNMPELEPVLQEGIFPLEYFSGEQLANLIDVVGREDEAEHERRRDLPESMDMFPMRYLSMTIEKDMGSLAEANPEKAFELFQALTEVERRQWPKADALEAFSKRLVRIFQEREDWESRQVVLERMIALIGDESDLVGNAAREILGEIVESDWLDEPTRQMIEERKRKR